MRHARSAENGRLPPAARPRASWLVVERFGFGVRRDAYLGLERSRATVVRVQCLWLVAQREVEAHELAVAALAEGIEVDELLGVPRRLLGSPKRFADCDEALEHMAEALPVAFARFLEPDGVVVRKHVAAVARLCLQVGLQGGRVVASGESLVGAGDGLVEPGNVDRRSLPMPTQVGRSDVEVGAQRRQQLQESAEQLAHPAGHLGRAVVAIEVEAERTEETSVERHVASFGPTVARADQLLGRAGSQASGLGVAAGVRENRQT